MRHQMQLEVEIWPVQVISSFVPQFSEINNVCDKCKKGYTFVRN